MSSAVAHVCGHLHTLGNTVFQMYGRHPGGHLELELGDFVGHRRYMDRWMLNLYMYTHGNDFSDLHVLVLYYSCKEGTDV